MYNNNSFKKDYDTISNRIEKILCDFPKYDPIFRSLKAAADFIIEKRLDLEGQRVVFATILEPHLDDLNSFLDYYKETIDAINKFADDYDDYRDNEVNAWLGTIFTINDILVFCNNIISNL